MKEVITPIIESTKEFMYIMKNLKVNSSFIVSMDTFLNLKEKNIIFDQGINRDPTDDRMNWTKFNSTTEIIYEQAKKMEKEQFDKYTDYPYFPIYVAFSADKKSFVVIDGGHRSNSWEFFRHPDSEFEGRKNELYPFIQSLIGLKIEDIVNIKDKNGKSIIDIIKSFRFRVFIVEPSEKNIRSLNSASGYKAKDIQKLKDILGNSTLYYEEENWFNETGADAPNEKCLCNPKNDNNKISSSGRQNIRTFCGIICFGEEKNANVFASKFCKVFENRPDLAIDLERKLYKIIISQPAFNCIFTKDRISFLKIAPLLTYGSEKIISETRNEILDGTSEYAKEFEYYYKGCINANNKIGLIDKYIDKKSDDPEIAYKKALNVLELFKKDNLIHKMVKKYPTVFNKTPSFESDYAFSNTASTKTHRTWIETVKTINSKIAEISLSDKN